MVRNVSTNSHAPTSRANSQDARQNDGNYNNYRNFHNQRGYGGRRGGRNYGNHGKGNSYYEGQPYRYNQHHFPQLPKSQTSANGPKPPKAEGDVKIKSNSDEETTSTPPFSEPAFRNGNARPAPVVSAVSPMPPVNLIPQLNLIWQGLPPNYQMDPDQLFILSGPFLGDDPNGSGVYEARQVPKGVTILATPALAAPMWPNGSDIVIRLKDGSPTLLKGGRFNPDAAPFYPAQGADAEQDEDTDDKSPAEGGNDAKHYDELKGGDPSSTNHQEKAKAPKYPRPPSVTVFNTSFPKGREFPLRQPQPPVYFHVPENQIRSCACRQQLNKGFGGENSTCPSQTSSSEA